MGQETRDEKRSWERRQHPDDQEIDVELLAFVGRYATGLLKWDIITFFARNPHTHDTATSIARFIGRNPQAVMLSLGDLVILGLLRQTRVNGQIIYHLTPNRALRDVTFRFVNCQDR